jgi:hypothetical protein
VTRRMCSIWRVRVFIPMAGDPTVQRRGDRSAIEAVIGHMKTDGHLGRCHLKGRHIFMGAQRSGYLRVCG